MTFTVTKRSTLKNLDPDENLITDTQFDVFDRVLSVGSDILCVELLQLAINHAKALTKIDKLELRVKQEQTASKSHQK